MREPGASNRLHALKSYGRRAGRPYLVSCMLGSAPKAVGQPAPHLLPALLCDLQGGSRLLHLPCQRCLVRHDAPQLCLSLSRDRLEDFSHTVMCGKRVKWCRPKTMQVIKAQSYGQMKLSN